MVHLLGGHLEPSRHTVVGVFRKRVVKGGGTTGVLDRRASDEKGGGDREPTETGNRLRQRTDYCTGTRPNKHREREQRTIQMNTTNEYVLMNERK